MRKKILIEFRPKGMVTKDHIEQLKVACKWASHNMALKYKIELSDPFIEDDEVYVYVDNVTEPFYLGTRLRGISNGLMYKYPEYREKYYKFGRGLLTFMEV